MKLWIITTTSLALFAERLAQATSHACASTPKPLRLQPPCVREMQARRLPWEDLDAVRARRASTDGDGEGLKMVASTPAEAATAACLDHHIMYAWGVQIDKIDDALSSTIWMHPHQPGICGRLVVWDPGARSISLSSHPCLSISSRLAIPTSRLFFVP